MAAAPSTSRKAVSRKSVGSELSMGNLSAQGASPSHEPSGMIRRSASNANSVWSDISASSSQPSPNQRDSASLANNNIQNSFLQPRMKVCGFCGTGKDTTPQLMCNSNLHQTFRCLRSQRQAIRVFSMHSLAPSDSFLRYMLHCYRCDNFS